MALRPQGIRELLPVVNVAVERDDHDPVGASRRLLPFGSSADRGAPDPEEEVVAKHATLSVRPALGQPTERAEVAREVLANA